MNKQFVVLGLGSFGASVAVTLQKLGCDVVAVDQDMELVTDIAEKVTYAMQADIENPKLLESLGSRNFDGMVVASSENLEGSILATLAAKEMGIPYILCKAHNERHAQVLRKIGADAVVFPEEEMGRKIAKNLVSANLADWIELSPDYSIVETAIPKRWIGKTLKELDVRRTYEVNVVGIREEEEGRVEITPNPEMPLKEGMILMLIGANEALEKI
ncbi:TrkA family potassium uptake protein [Lachnospiraceae bacterium WCA-9-b2]|jgi:K+ transport systems, NAD-binding component|uniref:TrkA family potassium uptake protein n=1 Tax=Sporofaciens musculi TaxID=2681861 RepID=A0A7X3SII2_9FIRM|nr:TrkA family potassium uptake protein [Sporofaciens musculi]MCI9423197.1 TrkA family potassium uptake protein [Dorea sp.]MXP75236.1 TrkA family potassium uptake protein [Sporofaciens musculi]